MQGKKNYQEKLFSSFQLSDYVPKDNFYRRLREFLDLSFLYSKTRFLYGCCGQKSIDPVVFFKLCLVGYLENIISDRKLIVHCKMRLDILYFLGYDIDEELPWHSTVSRTRQLYPEALFEALFAKVLDLCINKGMVSGHTQIVDSAPVKANYFICPTGKVIPFVKYFLDHRTKTKKKEYRASKHICKGCALKPSCLKKSQEKRITLTAYRAEYERNNKRVNSRVGRQMKKLRQSRVEPVFGTLLEHLGMRKVNTRGIAQANKAMLMAAVVYNLKKYLKFIENKRRSAAKEGEAIYFLLKDLLESLGRVLSPQEFTPNFN